MDTPHIDLAFEEFGTRYLVVPGGVYGQRSLLKSAGLPQSFPEPISRLLRAADDVGHRALARSGQEPILAQWNPYSGTWPYTLRRAYAANEDDTRWLIRHFEDSSRCLFDVLHESTHGQLAAIGQMGLLGGLSPNERRAFNTLSEAIAVLIGDIEGHDTLVESGYLNEFWPPSIQRSHAVALNPCEALRGANLITPTQRADWLFDLYLNGKEGFENLSSHSRERSMALGFLVEESGYAQKVLRHVGPTWERLYWQRPELESYIHDFVPPYPVRLPHIDVPIESVHDVRRQWHSLTLGWEPLPETLRDYLLCRLTIQRHALKAYELAGAMGHMRARLDHQPRRKALAILNTYKGSLQTAFAKFALPTGTSTSEGRDGLMAELDALRAKTISDLVSVLGPVLLLDHPWLDDGMMAYRWPSLSEVSPDQLTSEQCLAILERLIIESKSVLTHLAHEPSLRVYEEAHRLVGQLTLSPEAPVVLSQVQVLVDSVRAHCRLALPYLLEWAITDPYVEPRDGFRYS